VIPEVEVPDERSTSRRHMPRISVVMPVFNGGPAVRQAVGSVLAQSCTDFELIVVDDGSTDGALDFLSTLDDDRIRVLRNDVNVGPAKARNQAIEVARAPLIAIADADDMAHPLRLELQATFLDAHPDVTLVAGATQVFGNKVPVGHVSRPVTSHVGLTLGLRYGPSFYHGSVVVRTDALRAIDGYHDVPPVEDYDMYARLLVAGFRFAALTDVVLIYRVHPGSISKSTARDAARIHRQTSEYVRGNVAIPDRKALVAAARNEPALHLREPQVRLLKLLGRTAIEHLRTEPAVSLRCAAAALSTDPRSWARLARRSPQVNGTRA
jgi:glycosyltransferase involved in cell wall biosynthesis